MATSRLARDALGLGLRIPHYRDLFATEPAVDFFEIITENFLGEAAPPRRNLARVRARYPVVLHGVGLNLLGAEPLDEVYLDRVKALADLVDAPFVTDHLCWTGSEGVSHHDLLPAPLVPELIPFAAERARYVQSRLGRPFGLENVSSYLEFTRSTLPEWEFLSAVAEQADCGILLDVNNVFVSAKNHGFSPEAYLRAIDPARVLQVHLAGHQDGPEGLLVDTHDRPVRDEVWALYRRAWELLGPFPTLLEWDADVPPLPVALAELERAREARR
ncbi:MAG: DUF692 domain-containing protein [Deltaproteobacteria bacterium]|nr:DUF692 domain-containing protein [Deltaproteobacteria bacterium]